MIVAAEAGAARPRRRTEFGLRPAAAAFSLSQPPEADFFRRSGVSAPSRQNRAGLEGADLLLRSRMAHYLVTGGAGFIGSHLAEELVRRGEGSRGRHLITGKRRIWLTSRAWSSSRATLQTSCSRAGPSLECDYVLHQAAIPSVPRSVEDPLTSNRANVDGTLNMLPSPRAMAVRVRLSGVIVCLGDTSGLPKQTRPREANPQYRAYARGDEHVERRVDVGSVRRHGILHRSRDRGNRGLVQDESQPVAADCANASSDTSPSRNSTSARGPGSTASR